VLIEDLRDAHRWLDELLCDSRLTLESLASREGKGRCARDRRDFELLAATRQGLSMVATDDVGRRAAELLLEDWSGHRVVEVEGPARVSPNDLAEAFSKALDRSVAPKIAPRDEWEAVFRAQGITNPTPRAQMVDGFITSAQESRLV
jgi:uncharacterized protein YbjT (DUF2867 family)